MAFWDGRRWVPDEPKRTRPRRLSIIGHLLGGAAEAGLITILTFGLIAGAAFAGQGSHGGKSCTQNAPAAAVQNTWAWAAFGSYGMAGQRLTYQVQVINNDVGCRSSSFVLTLTAPSRFSVSIPTNTVSVKAGGSAYLSAYVTSPTDAPDGDYALTATVTRSGASGSSGSQTTYYKVYSSDSVAPTLFWPDPSNGATISGRSYWIQVSANDDHSVKDISLSLDGSPTAVTNCDDIAYTCALYYSWATVKGNHTAVFTSEDWMGNRSTQSVDFTVN